MSSFIYRVLCNVRIQHRYFLDLGETGFEELNESERAKRLLSYDWRECLTLVPLGNTDRFLRNHHLALKHTGESFRILVRMLDEDSQRSFIAMDQELTLIFGLVYKDPHFENFTEMPFLRESKILWANDLGSFQVSDSHLPLPVNEGQEFSGDYVCTDAEFGELALQLGLHQVGQVKGLLVLKMSGQSGNWNILNANGTVKQNPTTFHITFRNRQTYWRYIQHGSGFTAQTTGRKPLTKHGFVSVNPDTDFEGDPDWPPAWRFPNPSVNALKLEDDNLISEIYL